MKKFLMAVAALACMGSVALAGPNAGGTIFLHDANLVYTTDIASYCGMGTAPTSCAGADTVIDNIGTNMVFKVYAAFPDGSSPRLKGMTFGVYYPQDILVAAWGPCIGDLNNGAAEFPGAGWPSPNTGDAIVWQFTQTTQLVECYWFAAYSYSGAPACFCLGPNPDPGFGGNFGSDSTPPELDPIAGYGCLGFGQACESQHRCPGGPPPPLTGACCLPDHTCIVTDRASCDSQGGTYQGDDVPCTPTLCLPTGACCLADHSCIVTDQQTCEGQGGTYMGDNVPCTDTLCLPPTGACCLPDHTCIVTDQQSCEGQQGTYMGNDVPCTDTLCQPPNPVETTTWGQIKSHYR